MKDLADIEWGDRHFTVCICPVSSYKDKYSIQSF